MSNDHKNKTIVGWAYTPQKPQSPASASAWGNGYGQEAQAYAQPYGQQIYPPQPPPAPAPHTQHAQPPPGQAQLPEYLQSYAQPQPQQQPYPGYPPANGGYPPANGGYPPANGYPANGGYSPAGYPVVANHQVPPNPLQPMQARLLPLQPLQPGPGPAPAGESGKSGNKQKEPKAAKAPKPAKAAKPIKQAKPAKEPRPIAGADATVGVSQRVRFIRLTYLHLLFALLTFAGLLYLLMTNPFLGEHVSVPLIKFALGARWNWGIVLAAFMVVSWIADYWASHATSRALQYLGLLFYICAEALIFVPLLFIVEVKTHEILAKGGAEPHIIRDSAYVTMGIFSMLTASVFLTKKDFSYLRSGLFMASGAALTLIFLSIGFGFELGLVFSVAMVLLAAGYILYQTSQVLAHYDPRNHVAASLALFSSVALMFWYVIRIFMRARE